MAHFSRRLLKNDKLLTGQYLEGMRSRLDFFRRDLMIEVFHLDVKTPSHNEIFTKFVIVGRILSINSFKSFVGRVSSYHDLVFILKMIFLTSV